MALHQIIYSCTPTLGDRNEKNPESESFLICSALRQSDRLSTNLASVDHYRPAEADSNPEDAESRGLLEKSGPLPR